MPRHQNLVCQLCIILTLTFGSLALIESPTFAGQPIASGENETADDVSVSRSTDVMSLMVEGGESNRTNTIVRVPFSLSEKPPTSVTVKLPTGETIPGQIATRSTRDLSLPGFDGMSHELQFVLPKLGAGEKLTLTVAAAESSSAYKWHDDGSAESELQFNGAPLVKYMYQPLDESTNEKRGETYKTYHHVYRPDGKALMTKGHGGLFPHHRGLYYGFNRISYNGKQADVWHCKKGESQTHETSVQRINGPVFGRDLNVIHWRGQDGEPFVTEFRETTTRKIGESLVIDFHSTLQNLLDHSIEFRGDPQHAGAQFRATQDVPDHTKHLTFYIRPDGKGQPGKFRNWSGKKNESEINLGHINLAWNAVCLALPKDSGAAEGKLDESMTDRFTVCYLDSPKNPKPSRFSERDYVRFGSYFEYDLAPKASFSINYRYYISFGELTVEQINDLSKDFVEPVKVTVKK